MQSSHRLGDCFAAPVGAPRRTLTTNDRSRERHVRISSTEVTELGQAVVEFAIILPIFILLMLMAVDFGRFFFTYVQLNNSAREAVAYAAFNPTTDSAT